jgi:hypothetical protein
MRVAGIVLLFVLVLSVPNPSQAHVFTIENGTKHTITFKSVGKSMQWTVPSLKPNQTAADKNHAPGHRMLIVWRKTNQIDAFSLQRITEDRNFIVIQLDDGKFKIKDKSN